jgi:hypothetical protein
MNDIDRSVMKFLHISVLVFFIGTPFASTAGTEDYMCKEPFTIEATQLIATQACPATVDELNRLRPAVLQALQATADSECQTAQDAAGNRCPTAVLLGREPKTAVNCAAVELAIPGVPGPGIVGATLSLTISGMFQCN